jgi:tetratricopeptide (TPR) repeat protein
MSATSNIEPINAKKRNWIALAVVLLISGFWWFGPGSLGAPASSKARMGLSIMSNSSGDAAKRQEAKKLFQKALQADAADPIALFGLGWVEQLDGDNAQSKEHYARSIAELQDLLHAARFNQSLVLEQRGELRASYEEIRLLLRVDPSHEKARERQSYLVQKIGQQN